MNTTYAFIHKVSLLYTIAFYHFTYFTKLFYVLFRFSFEVEKLVTVVLVLFLPFSDLFFEVFNAFSESIEDANDTVLLGERGDGDRNFSNCS